MIANKKEFTGGFVMLACFIAAYLFFLSPVFSGQNLLNFMDGLYNSISKKSAYYIPESKEKADKFAGNAVSLTLKVDDKASGEKIANLLQKNDAVTRVEGESVNANADLGQLLGNILDDADAMFANNGGQVQQKYGYNEKEVLYGLWNTLKMMEANLKKQKKFKEAKIVHHIQTKAVEPAYNYYGIEAQNIKDKMGIVSASLAGYVVYTLWFGFAILFMFEGWGLKLEH